MLLLDDIDKTWLLFSNFKLNRKPDSNGYYRLKQKKLHQIILERKLGRSIQKGMVCDHLNRNRGDNRRDNLREVTVSENNRNKKVLQGYVYLKARNKYQAQIKKEGYIKYLGIFTTKEEAHLRYLKEQE